MSATLPATGAPPSPSQASYAPLEASGARGRAWVVSAMVVGIFAGAIVLVFAFGTSRDWVVATKKGAKRLERLYRERDMSSVRTWSLGNMAESASRWRIVNDVVMGGKSSSAISAAPGGVVFSGNININGGGFASCRLPIPKSVDLRQGTGIAVTAQKLEGASVRYKLQLKSSGFDVPSWQSDFFVREDGTASTIYVPFSKLLPSWRGRIMGEQGVPQDKLGEMSEIGLMLSFLTDRGERNQPGFEPGAFGILVTDLSVYAEGEL